MPPCQSLPFLELLEHCHLGHTPPGLANTVTSPRVNLQGRRGLLKMLSGNANWRQQSALPVSALSQLRNPSPSVLTYQTRRGPDLPSKRRGEKGRVLGRRCCTVSPAHWNRDLTMAKASDVSPPCFMMVPSDPLLGECLSRYPTRGGQAAPTALVTPMSCAGGCASSWLMAGGGHHSSLDPWPLRGREWRYRAARCPEHHMPTGTDVLRGERLTSRLAWL